MNLVQTQLRAFVVPDSWNLAFLSDGLGDVGLALGAYKLDGLSSGLDHLKMLVREGVLAAVAFLALSPLSGFSKRVAWAGGLEVNLSAMLEAGMSLANVLSVCCGVKAGSSL